MRCITVSYTHLALLEILKRQGKKVQAFKCGPDYIDPMFHSTVLGIPSKNLDTFFTGEKMTAELFMESAVDVYKRQIMLKSRISGEVKLQ